MNTNQNHVYMIRMKCQICGKEEPNIYLGLCKYHLNRATDPRWQLALPYRDEYQRRMEMNRTYANCETYRSNMILYSQLHMIRDFGLEKDGARMILDSPEIDKKLVHIMQVELTMILAYNKHIFQLLDKQKKPDVK